MPRLLEHGDSGQQFAERAAETVKAHDREGVPSRAYASSASKPGRSIVRPERTSLKTLTTPVCGQPYGLTGDILIAGRHPRIAENGAHAVSQTTVLWTETTTPGASSHSRPQNTSFESRLSTIMAGPFWDMGRLVLARRQLLTDEERRLLLGVPREPDTLARHYTLTRSDRDLVTSWRGAANRLGFAVQLALIRHPGAALAQMDDPVDGLIAWLAAQLGIPPAAFTEYARRSQTMTDHSRALAAVFGMRLPTAADLPLMIEAAAQAAWSTDRGHPIVAGTIAALRAEKVLLPASAVIERAAIAGRARACKRAADALLDAVSAEQIAKLDKLLTVDPAVGMTPYAWLKNLPTSPKADHSRELIDRLRFVRDIGLPSGASTRLHEDRFEQFVREGRLSDAHQIERYAAHARSWSRSWSTSKHASPTPSSTWRTN